jgi:serine/threonine protein phosphatase 1
MFGLFTRERAVARGPKGRRAYAVGDIHGRLDLLDRLLADIDDDLRASPAEALVIFLGDLIDRGPESAQVIERLRTYRRDGVQPVFILGNHEEVLLRIIDGDAALIAKWRWFGGTECLMSYGLARTALEGMSEAQALDAVRKAVPPEHVEFLRGFADTCRFGDYLFVHAGIRPGVELSSQKQADLRWIRDPFLADDSEHGFVVVHGHTISNAVEERSNRIGIDTGAYRTGVLTALVIEGEQRRFLSTAPDEASIVPSSH